jgi:GrpB-like predicted nucleotidyltransferase (UPF0157 family)
MPERKALSYVEIVPYDPIWAHSYAAEHDRLIELGGTH